MCTLLQTLYYKCALLHLLPFIELQYTIIEHGRTDFYGVF